jgi:hypothetical protein
MAYAISKWQNESDIMDLHAIWKQYMLLPKKKRYKQ